MKFSKETSKQTLHMSKTDQSVLSSQIDVALKPTQSESKKKEPKPLSSITAVSIPKGLG